MMYCLWKKQNTLLKDLTYATYKYAKGKEGTKIQHNANNIYSYVNRLQAILIFFSKTWMDFPIFLQRASLTFIEKENIKVPE